MGEVL